MNLARRILLIGVVALLLVAAAFVANGVSTGWRSPEISSTDGPGAPDPHPDELVVATWNLAKANFHRGGLRFASETDVRELLATMAAELAPHAPDLVVLTEVVREGGPCRVDQVAVLAQELGLRHRGFGENKSFGVPGLRVRAGNAVLSRFPLGDGRVVQLAGPRPFWEPTNNRRFLMCTVHTDAPFVVGAVRNDSFDLDNNAKQAEEILAELADVSGPVLLAGDFNAEPHDRALQLFVASGRFGAGIEGPATYPARQPERRIDHVLAPAGWTRVEELVQPTELSDHRPVVVRLRR